MSAAEAQQHKGSGVGPWQRADGRSSLDHLADRGGGVVTAHWDMGLIMSCQKEYFRIAQGLEQDI